MFCHPTTYTYYKSNQQSKTAIFMPILLCFHINPLFIIYVNIHPNLFILIISFSKEHLIFLYLPSHLHFRIQYHWLLTKIMLVHHVHHLITTMTSVRFKIVGTEFCSIIIYNFAKTTKLKKLNINFRNMKVDIIIFTPIDNERYDVGYLGKMNKCIPIF